MVNCQVPMFRGPCGLDEWDIILSCTPTLVSRRWVNRARKGSVENLTPADAAQPSAILALGHGTR